MFVQFMVHQDNYTYRQCNCIIHDADLRVPLLTIESLHAQANEPLIYPWLQPAKRVAGNKPNPAGIIIFESIYHSSYESKPKHTKTFPLQIIRLPKKQNFIEKSAREVHHQISTLNSCSPSVISYIRTTSKSQIQVLLDLH